MTSQHVEVEVASQYSVLPVDANRNEYQYDNAVVGTPNRTARIALYRKAGDPITYVTKYHMKLIRTVFGLIGEKLSTEATIYPYGVDVGMQTLKIEHLNSFEGLITLKAYQLKVVIDEDKANIPLLAAVFMCIPGFRDAYENYLEDPDNGVEVIQEEVNALGFLSRYELSVKPVSDMLSMASFFCTAYIVALLCNKKIVIESQYSEVISKRIAALRKDQGYHSVNVEDVKGKLIQSQMMKLSDCMTFLPKFKAMVNQVIILSTSPVWQHIKLILKDSQMTAYIFIHDFLSHETKTQLHLSHQVMIEACKWLESFKTLTSLYKGNWRYYKLLEPEGSLTNITDMKNLANAALSFLTVHTPSAGLTNVKGIAPKESFQNLARKKIPDRFLSASARSTTSIVTELTRLYTDANIPIGVNVQEALQDPSWMDASG